MGAPPDGGVIVHVTVPCGVMEPLPWTVTFTVKGEPTCGLAGEVEKPNVGVPLLTLIVAGVDDAEAL